MNAQLAALASAVGHDRRIVDRFVGDFLSLLHPRVRAVEKAVAAHDVEDAVVTLLSLETSGAMVGAAELSAAAAQVRAALGRGEGESVVADIAALRAAAVRVPALLGRSDPA